MVKYSWSTFIFNLFCSFVVLWLFRAWYGRNLLVILYSVSWYLVFLCIWLCLRRAYSHKTYKTAYVHFCSSYLFVAAFDQVYKFLFWIFFYVVCNILMILHNYCFQWQKDNWCLGAVIVPNKEVCLLDNFLRYKRGVNAQVHGLHNNTKLLSTVDCQLIGKYWLSPCFLL